MSLRETSLLNDIPDQDPYLLFVPILSHEVMDAATCLGFSVRTPVGTNSEVEADRLRSFIISQENGIRGFGKRKSVSTDERENALSRVNWAQEKASSSSRSGRRWTVKE